MLKSNQLDPPNKYIWQGFHDKRHNVMHKSSRNSFLLYTDSLGSLWLAYLPHPPPGKWAAQGKLADLILAELASKAVGIPFVLAKLALW